MNEESIKTTIVKIGNSQGIRIPKALLALSGIERRVEIRVSDGVITIRPARTIRDGWADAFQAMATSGDDALIDVDTQTQWDVENWEW